MTVPDSSVLVNISHLPLAINLEQFFLKLDKELQWKEKKKKNPTGYFQTFKKKTIRAGSLLNIYKKNFFALRSSTELQMIT